MSSGGTFIYPNVSQVPASRTDGLSERKLRDGQGAKPGEFGKIFDEAIESPTLAPLGEVRNGDSLKQLRPSLKFSAHASQRMQERKILIDAPTMQRVNDAVDKAESKGVEDTLIITQGAALIINVPNRTVVTAMDRGSLNGNVFTNIDGAVIV